MRRALGLRVAILALLASTLLAGGCGGSTRSGDTSAGISVVAAENFWGSIARQLAGSRADVQSVITDPASDPHSYEPTATDARSLASAQLVILNGIGYDPWAPKLLAANPAAGRIVLSVGDLLGLEQGDNPHRWYNPADVEAVAGAITSALKRLDARDGAYFTGRLAAFEDQRLARYKQLIASIKSRYAGEPVGASESIFALLSPALGLRLLTPASFMKAISEGTEVSAQDTASAQRQLERRQIKVWIFNAQNASPQVQLLDRLARAHRIPIATVTETLSPRGASFEDWQVAQLESLARALHQATGR